VQAARPAAAQDAPAASPNPCLRCGACCASLRVDFAVEELQSEGGCVPDGLALPLTATLMRLRGTDHQPPRCAALTGSVGMQVACAIHEWRPSPCREFGQLAPLGRGDPACDAARARHGLPPLD
jgi:Fe-S-cluster containining protein